MTTTMPKRKREPTSPAEGAPSTRPETTSAAKVNPNAVAAPASPPRLSSRQRTTIAALLNSGKKDLTKALKLARGFERQKLSRRKKTAEAGKDQPGVEKVCREIRALKACDFPVLAEGYMLRVLGRVKAIANTDVLPTAPTDPPKKDALEELAAANIRARLCASQPVRECVDGIVERVKGALGAVGRTSETTNKPRAPVSDDVDMDADSESEEEGWNGFSSSDGAGSGSGVEDAASESDDFGTYDARLAPGSDSDSDNESDAPSLPSSIDSAASQLHIELADTIRKAKATAPLLPTADPAVSKPNSSTFLPSLTMAGYWSGSDSAPSDLGEEIAPRKNRRGQRARRAIWEKKYGDKAKHVANAPKERGGRDEGWDLKRGAQGTDGHGRGRRSTGANTEPVVEREKKVVPRRKDDEGPLHPSWVAKKKVKEAMGKMEFKGTKVTFD
ncbi:Bud-site selection protein [Trichodelitschia bisporula]|uniref:Bud-site selection protein n=1 Tax=Trichodelitschia bisporula TaxID=703511 RepID=A0A6G1HLQ7_9PEZI|nr:Bud-site selection protein [Trichodelitschia bisporula]